MLEVGSYYKKTLKLVTWLAAQLWVSNIDGDKAGDAAYHGKSFDETVTCDEFEGRSSAY